MPPLMPPPWVTLEIDVEGADYPSCLDAARDRIREYLCLPADTPIPAVGFVDLTARPEVVIATAEGEIVRSWRLTGEYRA